MKPINNTSTDAVTLADEAESLEKVKRKLANSFQTQIKGKNCDEVTNGILASPAFEIEIGLVPITETSNEECTVIQAVNLETAAVNEIVRLITTTLSDTDIGKLYIAFNEVYHYGLHAGVDRATALIDQVRRQLELEAVDAVNDSTEVH